MNAGTLTEALAARGYTHLPAANQGRRDVIDASGTVVVTGTAADVWLWLYAQDALHAGDRDGDPRTADACNAPPGGASSLQAFDASARPPAPVLGATPIWSKACDDCHGAPLALECMACGERDCPLGEPLHYHHDGCPACSCVRCGQEHGGRACDDGNPCTVSTPDDGGSAR